MERRKERKKKRKNVGNKGRRKSVSCPKLRFKTVWLGYGQMQEYMEKVMDNGEREKNTKKRLEIRKI